jgi:phenylalanyl-tRNA synthetase beta chain
VSTQRITEYLGLELPVNRIAQILEDLGCQVSLKKGVFSVVPPTFRPDITIPADVIEEIARIYGYHNLPSVLMATPIPLNRPTHTNFDMENRIKRFLAAVGWQEVYTYSMVSAEIARQSGHQLDQHLLLQNPLTDDRVYLRRSLLPSLNEILDQNPQYPQLSVFEFANTYTPVEKTLPLEALHLSLVSRRELRAVKGDLENLLRSLYVTGVEYHQEGSTKALITADGGDHERITIGELSLLSKDVVAIDVPFEKLLAASHVYPHYQPLAKTNAVIEDLTFTVPDDVTIAQLLQTIRAISPLIKDVTYLDRYQQNVSFRFSYQDPETQIEDATVQSLRKSVITGLAQHQARLVGNNA